MILLLVGAIACGVLLFAQVLFLAVSAAQDPASVFSFRASRTPKMHLQPVEYVGLGFGPPSQRKTHPLVKQASEEAAQGRERQVVVHITKEFGDAKFGGLGSIVTNLAVTQARQGTEVYVVMPCFDYLVPLYRTRLSFLMNITLLADSTRGLDAMEIPIYSLDYQVTPRFFFVFHLF